MKIIKHALILLLTLTMIACVSLTKVKQPEKLTPAQPYSTTERQLLRKIHRTGVAVIKESDRLMVVIPIDRYFVAGSPTLKRSRKASVEQISWFIQSYAQRYYRPIIYIRGFIDNASITRSQNDKLSGQYAQVISSYLWTYGLANYKMRVGAFGTRRAIASNRTPKGAAFNRRVVILLK